MRNLIHLIKRQHVLLLFLVLQFIALRMVIQSHYYHQSVFLNSSNRVTGWIYAKRAQLSEYFKLNEINDNLAVQNSMLRSVLPDNFIDIDSATTAYDSTHLLKHFKFHSARIINNSINRQANYITIDKGSLSGIKPDMGVISNQSIVGYVVDVSPHFAVVMPVLHRSFTSSVRMKQSSDQAFLKWDGASADHAQVTGLPKHVNVQVGDTVVTTGFSHYFPAGLLAGFVHEIESNDDETEYRITIRLSTSFRRLTHVEVAENLVKQELETLEQKVEKKFDPDNRK